MITRKQLLSAVVNIGVAMNYSVKAILNPLALIMFPLGKRLNGYVNTVRIYRTAKYEYSKLNPYHKMQFARHIKENNLNVLDCTCVDCTLITTCEYKFDLYNFNGDCLADK